MAQRPDSANAHSYSSHGVSIPRPEREVFRKRKATFMNKANELASFTGSDVYVVVRFYDRLVTFVSSPKADWPPPQSLLVKTSTEW